MLLNSVPAGDDKSKIGKKTSITKTIPNCQLRDLQPSHDIAKRAQTANNRVQPDKRAIELQSILNNIQTMRKKKLNQQMRGGQIEKIEKRLDNIKSDDFVPNSSHSYGLLGMTL